MRRGSWIVALTLLFPAAVSAQSLRIGAYGVVATHTEVAASNRVDGFGGAAGGELIVTDRIAVEGFGYYASLTASDSVQSDYKVLEGQFHVRYALTPLVDVEVGYVRRHIDPEFAAQDIGALSLGARLHNDLANVAEMFARGAFVPVASFAGGGSTGLSYHVGFGIRFGPATAPWRVSTEYDFLRFGRTVRDADVPVQSETARVGLELRIF